MNDITTTQPGELMPVHSGNDAVINWLQPERFEQIWRIAQALSRSALVPEHFHGKPEDCFVATQLAFRLGVDPLTALQNVYVVGGRPGMSAGFVVSLANASGRLKQRIKYQVDEGPEIDVTVTKGYRWDPDKRRKVPVTETQRRPNIVATAYAVTSDGEHISETVDLATAESEGWTSNPKYSTGLAALMLRYRAATFLVRLHLPDVLMGMSAVEELEDTAQAGATIDSAPDEELAATQAAQRINEAAHKRAAAQRERDVATHKHAPESAVSAQEAGEEEPAPPEAPARAEPQHDVTNAGQDAEFNSQGKMLVKDDSGHYVDKNGARWDPEIHATGKDGKPTYNQDNTFRARRGAKAQAGDERQEEPPAPGQGKDPRIVQGAREPIVEPQDKPGAWGGESGDGNEAQGGSPDAEIALALQGLEDAQDQEVLDDMMDSARTEFGDDEEAMHALSQRYLIRKALLHIQHAKSLAELRDITVKPGDIESQENREQLSTAYKARESALKESTAADDVPF